MKVYKVKIYKINHFTDFGRLDNIDEEHDTYALVKQDFFGVREIITNKEVKVCFDEVSKHQRENVNGIEKLVYKMVDNTALGKYLAPSNLDNVDLNEYKKYGYVLGVKKNDLVPMNLATEEDLDNYLNEFPTSKLKHILSEMKIIQVRNKEIDKVNKRVKQLSKIQL